MDHMKTPITNAIIMQNPPEMISVMDIPAAMAYGSSSVFTKLTTTFQMDTVRYLTAFLVVFHNPISLTRDVVREASWRALLTRSDQRLQ